MQPQAEYFDQLHIDPHLFADTLNPAVQHRINLQFASNLRRIFAAILVDKASQRPILIGAGGEVLKRIGTEARLDMQKLFGGPVYLELFVKIKSGWSENAAVLRDLGIT